MRTQFRNRRTVTKGDVFTEFLTFVESALGAEIVDQILDDCAPSLSTGGAYTAVGAYPCAEMGALLGALSRRSERPPNELLRGFGEALAGAFVAAYPDYFKGSSNFFDFVERIDSYIHVEVLKLYPDAESPRFETLSREDDAITLRYTSPRALYDLAIGLFLATAAHYTENVDVDVALCDAPGQAIFTLRRAA